MCYLNATHREYEDTSLSLFHGGSKPSPSCSLILAEKRLLTPSVCSGEPTLEQMANTDCRGQISCRECQQNCFQFCFIQNVLDTLTQFKNCSYINQTFLKSIIAIKKKQSNVCPNNM